MAKKKVSGSLKLPIPTNADLRERYEKMIEEKRVLRNPVLEKALKTRGIRTSSGIAAVAVLTKSPKCPGNCLYCPTEPKMPKSYLSNEPAVMRAIASKFDPYLQVQNRLRSLALNGHAIDKIEIIVLGGTFSYFSKKYQTYFIAECFRAANEYSIKNSDEKKGNKIFSKLTPKNLDLELKKEQKKNETAHCRIIGLTLETRPDYINEKEIINFRRLGATRVELGVQSVFDEILKFNRRGHTIEATAKATKLLKDAGFKINYHIMPGLPGSTPKKDYQMFHILFHDERFQPDYLKIYPTVVTRFSDLYKLWQEKKYRPLTDKVFGQLIKKIKNELIPPYVRIVRLVRDIPIPSIVAGPKISNLRQIIASDISCQCIRCREVRENYLIKDKLTLKKDIYPASDGQEIFLEYSTPDRKKLFALLRLRFPENKNLTHFIPTLRGSAIIREVHTYGLMNKLHEKNSRSPQHMGLGKKLILEAEKLAKEAGFEKIAVIAGIGVREYYRKLGYKLQDSYLVKNLL